MATAKKAAKPAAKKAPAKVAAKPAAKPAAKKAACKAEKLAIEGGAPVNSKAFPTWPQFEESTVLKVADLLRTGKVNYWTGKVGMEFEEEWAKWLGVNHAISVANGTCALHTALASMGIGPGDEVICTSYSFIASSFCALQAGALPVFVDVDEATGCTDLLPLDGIDGCGKLAAVSTIDKVTEVL